MFQKPQLCQAATVSGNYKEPMTQIPNDITEHKIQTFIWENRNEFCNFLVEPLFPEDIKIENPSYSTASEIQGIRF